MSEANSQLTEVQNLIGWWGDNTFPDSTAETVLSHLQEEIGELVDVHGDYSKNDRDRALEAADCFLLTIQYAHKMRFDILDMAMQKMKVNMAREWNVENPEPGGHIKHIKNEDQSF